MKKALVTGGCGYIGSSLVQRMTEVFDQVTVIDNCEVKRNVVREFAINPKVVLHRTDACDVDKFREEIETSEVIVPLAGYVGAPICARYPSRSQQVNVNAIRDLLEHVSKEQFVVLPVSNSGYGIGDPDTICTEDSPLRPVSLYGQQKAEAEQLVLEHQNAVTTRLATVFGYSPAMRYDLMVNAFINDAIRNRFLMIFEGHFRRNFIHIQDVCDAILHLIAKKVDVKGEVFNVGNTAINMTKLELANRVAGLVGGCAVLETSDREDPDKRDYLVSNEKLEDTGWQPKRGLEQGVAEISRLISITG